MKDILEKLRLVRFASLFPLVDRYHLIKDKDGDIWVFRDKAIPEPTYTRSFSAPAMLIQISACSLRTLSQVNKGSEQEAG